MSDEKAAEDGILGRARHLARAAWDYIRSDEAKSRIDGARRKAVEVGKAASVGAKEVGARAVTAAGRVKERADEFSRTEKAQAVRAKARDGWEEFRGGTYPGGTLSESRIVVGLAIVLCFPLGLYLLWRHPTLARRRWWWWAGGIWGLVFTLNIIPGTDDQPASSGKVPEPVYRAAGGSASMPAASDNDGRFFVLTDPIKVLPVGLPIPEEPVTKIEFSPDGKYLITQGCVWRTSDWQPLLPDRSLRIYGAIFAQDGRSFAARTPDGLLLCEIRDDSPLVVDAFQLVSQDGDEARRALAFPYIECDAAWTPLGLAYGDGRSPLRRSIIPFLRAGSRKMSFDLGDSTGTPHPYSLAFSERARMMARLRENDPTLAANRVPGYEELPYGRKSVEVWDWDGVGTRPLFRTEVPGDSVAYQNQIAFLPDGKTFLLTYTEEDVRHVVMYDTASWKETNRFVSDETNFRIAAISPDGSIIASTSGGSSFGSHEDYSVSLWSPTSPKPMRKIKSLHAEYILFTPDGKTLATSIGPSARGGKTYHINFFDVATGACIGRIEDEGICGIALSPDGKLLVSGHGDSIAKVWDLTSGHQAPYQDEYEPYNRKLAEEHAEDERLSRPAPPMSRAVFNSLQEGMNYLEVRKLVGGTEHSSESDMRKVDFQYHSYRTIYVLGYRGNGGTGSGVVLVFGRDSMANLPACKLIGKRQTGLK